ncbi:hypothetical protein V8E53_000131 [Lactarius tabidus]
MSATLLLFTSSPIPRAGSQHSSLSTQSIQNGVLLVPDVACTPTETTKTTNLPIPTSLPSDPPPPTASKPPDLSFFVDPQVEEVAAQYASPPFFGRTFSHARPTRTPSNATHEIRTQRLSRPVPAARRKRRIEERISAESTEKNNPPQDLLIIERVDHFPFPSYPADVFQKSEGWIETPQNCG